MPQLTSSTADLPTHAAAVSALAASGGMWLLASRAAQQGASLAQAAVLARFLTPHDFGVFGIANVAVFAAGVFLSTGFEYAVVQKPDLTADDLGTAWWVSLGRYILLCAALLALAHPTASFFRTPAAAPVLIAVAVIQPLHGLAAPTVFLLRREMRFRSLFHLEVGSAVVGLAVGIVSSTVLRNAWALVAAYAAASCTTAVLSYHVHPARPSFRFSLASARQLLHYGKWITGNTIVGFASSQGPAAFAGWMFGAAPMGVLQMACRFTVSPLLQVGDSFQAALVPAFARIQSDPARTARAQLRVMRLAAAAVLPCTLVLMFALPKSIPLILGDRWAAVSVLAPWLAVAGGIGALWRVTTAMHFGTGQPRYPFYGSLAQALGAAVLIVPLSSRYGLPGTAVAIAAGSLVALPFWILIERRGVPLHLPASI